MLTKRARRLAELSREIDWPDNVWLGTSVENERQLHRMPSTVGQVDVVPGSHNEARVLKEAFAGADTVFWVVPPDPHAASMTDHYLDFARPACEAIRNHNLRRMVIVSTLGRGYTRDAGLLSAALEMDALIRATGVDCRVLRMPFFMENLLGQIKPICSRGTFCLPNAPDRKLATVTTRDVASVAADLLLDGSWTGQDDVAVVGTDDLSPQEMGRVMCRTLRRPVHFQQTDPQAFEARLLRAGVTEAWTRGLVEMAATQDDGIYSAGRCDDRPANLTDFSTWCESVLRPAIQASRAKEITEGFGHLREVDPVLGTLLDHHPEYDADAWRGDLPVTDLFSCLVNQIVGQQISLKAACDGRRQCVRDALAFAITTKG